jgi:hypothetical protein
MVRPQALDSDVAWILREVVSLAVWGYSFKLIDLQLKTVGLA